MWRVAEEGGASAASDAANNAAGAGADAELLKAIMRYAPRPTVSAAGKRCALHAHVRPLLCLYDACLEGACTHSPAAALSAMSDKRMYIALPLNESFARSYSATLEALLIGHEDWVHSCSWQPRPASSGAASTSSGGQGTDEEVPRQELLLLTTSMDRSMVLWEYEVRKCDSVRVRACVCEVVCNMFPCAR